MDDLGISSEESEVLALVALVDLALVLVEAALVVTFAIVDDVLEAD